MKRKFLVSLMLTSSVCLLLLTNNVYATEENEQSFYEKAKEKISTKVENLIEDKYDGIKEYIEDKYDGIKEYIEDKYDTITDNMKNAYNKATNKIEEKYQNITENMDNQCKEKIENGYEKITDCIEEKYDQITNDIKEEYQQKTNKIEKEYNLFKNREYEVLEGVNQEFDINKDTNLTFRFDANYIYFRFGGRVYIDDKEVESSNYSSKSGSTVITFKDEFVKSLSEGNHTLRVAFNNGRTSTAVFTIKNSAEKKSTESESTEKEETKSSDSIESTPATEQKIVKVSNPKTGDNVIVYIVLTIVSILGISVLRINKNK